MTALAAFLAFQGFAPPTVPAPTTVLATVGGAPITAGEIAPYLWAWKSREVAAELASHRMVADEAAKRGITVTDAEVQTAVDNQIANVTASLQPGQSIEKVLQGAGGVSHLALAARSSLLVDRIAQADFHPEGYVKVATILFRTTGSTTAELGKAIAAADAASASLKAGKSWETVLRASEKDDRIVNSGGVIGWKDLTVFPEGLRKELKSAKPNGITTPVQTENGIQIFRVLAQGDSASPSDLAELKGQYFAGARRSIVERLSEAAKVEIK